MSPGEPIPIPLILCVQLINPINLMILLVRALLNWQGIGFTRMGDLIYFGPILSVATALAVYSPTLMGVPLGVLFQLLLFWCVAGALVSYYRHSRTMNRKSGAWWACGAYVGMSLFSVPLVFGVGGASGLPRPSGPSLNDVPTQSTVRTLRQIRDAEIRESALRDARKERPVDSTTARPRGSLGAP